MKIGFPGHEDLRLIIDKTTQEEQAGLQHILTAESILKMRKLVRQVPIAEHVKNYAIRMLLATHPEDKYAPESIKKYVMFGASPRGVQTLVMAAKASALLGGRYNVSRSDIRAIAKPALRHRLVLNIKGEAEGLDPDKLIDEIIDSIPEKKVVFGKVVD